MHRPVPTSSGLLELMQLDAWVASWQDLANRMESPGGRLQTVNTYHAFLYRNDPEFRDHTNHSTALVADGWPVRTARSLASGQGHERITGSELCARLLEREWLPSHQRVGLLGGEPSTTRRYAAALGAAHRNVPVLDTREVSGISLKGFAKACSDSRVTLILIALPSTSGERASYLLHQQLGHVWTVCIGAGFEMVVGASSRAPGWVQRCGGEWAWRLVREPSRLWRRYLLECLPTAVLQLPLAVALARRQRRRRTSQS